MGHNVRSTLSTSTGCVFLKEIPSYCTLTKHSKTSGWILGLNNVISAPSSLVECSIGLPVFRSFMSLSQAKLYWMTPSWGTSTSQIPVETSMLLLELHNSNEYAIMLPLIDNNTFRASIRPSQSNNTSNNTSNASNATPATMDGIVLRMESGDDTVKQSSFTSALFIVSSNDLFKLIDTAVCTAASLSGTAQPRTQKQPPVFIDYFGFCTWDAFYTTVHPAGIKKALDGLSHGGTPVRFLLIDDGWQTTDLDTYGGDGGGDGGVNDDGRLTARMKTWSVDAIKSQRTVVESVFQDFQITEPLRQLELEKQQKKHHEQYHNNHYNRNGLFSMLLHTMTTVFGLHYLLIFVHFSSTLIKQLFYKILSFLERHIISMLQQTLENTSSDSSSISVFIALTKGPFRRALLRFYSSASTHSRRLISVKANAKFCAEKFSIMCLNNNNNDSNCDDSDNGIATPILNNNYNNNNSSIIIIDNSTNNNTTTMNNNNNDNNTVATDFLQTSPMNLECMNKESTSFDIVIHQLKQQCNINYVLCWIALAGYWSGVMPHSNSTDEYDVELMYPRPSSGTLEVDPSMAWVHPAVVGWGVPRNHHALHASMLSYLSQSGVDGIKIDVQSTISMFGWRSGGSSSIASRFHNSIEDTAAVMFNSDSNNNSNRNSNSNDGNSSNNSNSNSNNNKNNIMNSMCCSINDLYNFKHSAVARVGEDYYPSLPASHLPHIADAAYTSCLVGSLAWPDWDTFQSHHDAASIHAAARAISGGPIYISDRVDDHDFTILKRLVIENDGRILRCCMHARPTKDCMFRNVSQDDKTVLKIWNMNRVCGVVGAFHVQGSKWVVKKRAYVVHDDRPRRLMVKVKPSDVDVFDRRDNSGGDGDRFVVYSDKNKSMRVLKKNESWSMMMDNGFSGFDLFVVSLIHCINHSSNNNDDNNNEVVYVAPIGLVNYYNAGGAVLSFCIDQEKKFVEMDVMGSGEFAMYSSKTPKTVIVDGSVVDFDECVVDGGDEVLVKFMMEPYVDNRIHGNRKVLVVY